MNIGEKIAGSESVFTSPDIFRSAHIISCQVARSTFLLKGSITLCTSPFFRGFGHFKISYEQIVLKRYFPFTEMLGNVL